MPSSQPHTLSSSLYYQGIPSPLPCPQGLPDPPLPHPCAHPPRVHRACQFLIQVHEERGDKVIVFSDNIWALRCVRPGGTGLRGAAGEGGRGRARASTSPVLESSPGHWHFPSFHREYAIWLRPPSPLLTPPRVCGPPNAPMCPKQGVRHSAAQALHLWPDIAQRAHACAARLQARPQHQHGVPVKG